MPLGPVLVDETDAANCRIAAWQLPAESRDDRASWLNAGAVRQSDVRRPGLMLDESVFAGGTARRVLDGLEHRIESASGSRPEHDGLRVVQNLAEGNGDRRYPSKCPARLADPVLD